MTSSPRTWSERPGASGGDVQLILTHTEAPHHHDDNIIVRTLSFTDTVDEITVGRASATKHKDLAPESDNAWISCPVISRPHAKFSLSRKSTDETAHVFITDLHSSHGTYLNGDRLEASVPQPLRGGDLVRFGVEVARDTDTFYPPTYRVDIQEASASYPTPPNRSFSFGCPSSDEESDEVESLAELFEEDHSENNISIGGCRVGDSDEDNKGRTLLQEAQADDMYRFHEDEEASRSVEQLSSSTTAEPAAPSDARNDRKRKLDHSERPDEESDIEILENTQSNVQVRYLRPLVKVNKRQRVRDFAIGAAIGTIGAAFGTVALLANLPPGYFE